MAFLLAGRMLHYVSMEEGESIFQFSNSCLCSMVQWGMIAGAGVFCY